MIPEEKKMTDNRSRFYERLDQQHTNYMSALLKRLSEIRKEQGKDHALLIVTMHEIEGDRFLSKGDFELLKTYVREEQYHTQQKP